ncbi:MAG: hypothetical protein FD137_2432, partial [Spirochaetes bacterium]
NPLACAVGVAAIEVLEEEKLDQKAMSLGKIFREAASAMPCRPLCQVRGKGLLNAVVFKEGFDAYAVCVALKDAGVLAKQTHGNIIRFAPPLVISEDELRQALARIASVFHAL